MSSPLDDLELELRKLPGVRAAGFDERDDLLIVQLHMAPEHQEQGVTVTASRIAARHSDRPVAMEIVRWRTAVEPAPAVRGLHPGDRRVETGERVLSLHDEERAEAGASRNGEGNGAHRPKLLAVLTFRESDELEVHLSFEGRRTIGRAAASGGLVAAVEATLDAIEGFGASVRPAVRWARAIEEAGEDRMLAAVALEHEDDGRRLTYGLAPGASLIDAAARATLDAVNRTLVRVT